jgi:hypothetical protein
MCVPDVTQLIYPSVSAASKSRHIRVSDSSEGVHQRIVLLVKEQDNPTSACYSLEMEAHHSVTCTGESGGS